MKRAYIVLIINPVVLVNMYLFNYFNVSLNQPSRLPCCVSDAINTGAAPKLEHGIISYFDECMCACMSE